MSSPLLRHLPSVSDLLENPRLKELVEKVNRNTVVDVARSILDEIRSEIKTAATDRTLPNLSELADRIVGRVQKQGHVSLVPVINATGVLLHTGLGRAPLAEEAIEAISHVARDYCSVEFDLTTGLRANRNDVVATLLCELTGAEAALVVNNNAAATVLVLGALAAGKEVVLARGELVEIGGSFRLPEVMQTSGARLREVGTTNMTRLDDYRQAINDQTGMLLKVHTSNYRVVGFHEEASLADLVALGRQHRLPVVHDAGSGAMLDLAPFGCREEPVIGTSIQKGADLVLFSGDKLLGGPQAGIIVGKRDLIADMQKHPLARAFRVDKLTLAGLAATLSLYRKPETARQQVPFLSLLDTSLENLKQRAERMAPQIAGAASVTTAEAVQSTCFIGGGSVPAQEIPTYCVSIQPKESADALCTALRAGSPPVVARIQQDRVLLDLRTVFPRQDQALVAAVERVGQT